MKGRSVAPLVMPVSRSQDIDAINRQFGRFCQQAIDVMFPAGMDIQDAIEQTSDIFQIDVADGESERVMAFCDDLRHGRHGAHFGLTLVSRDGADHSVMVLSPRTEYGRRMLRLIGMLYVEQCKSQMAETLANSIVSSILHGLYKGHGKETAP